MEQVLRTAVDAGLNYVDLLYAAPKGADAEFWTSFGPVLRRYRDKLVLAAHWGSGGDEGRGSLPTLFRRPVGRDWQRLCRDCSADDG